MRSIKAKQGTSLFTAALIVIATFIAPTPAVAAPVESRGVYVDAIGRAGSKIVVTVMSKLANGATSTTDVGFASLHTGPGGTSANSSFSSAPFKILNSIAYYKITLNAGPLVGSYQIYAGVASTGTADISSALTYGNGSRYINKYLEVGGTAATVKFSSRQLKVSPSATTNITDLSPSGLVLFDGAGIRTLLSDTETVQISTVSAPVGGLPVYALGSDTRTATAGSSTLGFSSANNNGDGIFRFKVGNAIAGTSVVRATLLANSTTIATSSFSLLTGSSAVTGRSVQIVNNDSYGNGRMYASGTDGKLYAWGTRLTGISDLVSSIDVGLRNDVKPTLIEFPKASGSQNYNYVQTLVKLVSGLGINVLSDDGTLWATNLYSGLSAEQAISGNLEPIFTQNLDSNFISSVSEDSNLLLLNDGTVLTRVANAWNFNSFDLSSIGNPTITQVARMRFSGTNLLLASNGKLYSSGSNTYGELGQGTDTATALGEVVLPANRTVSKVYAGTRFGAVKMVDGSYWSWGDNRIGQQGKPAADVPYSNTPRVVISPTDFTVTNFVADSAIILMGSNTAYYARAGVWVTDNSLSYAGVPIGENFSSISFAQYEYSNYVLNNSVLIATSTGKIYQGYGPTGSCLSTTGRVRSDGQFGERWFVDPVQSGSKLLIDSTTTTSITGAISVKVNTPFTVQAANVKTNCYPTSELTFAWDKDGNGSYETPDTPTVGDTGYLGLNASFNFATAGRRNVTLGVTTPDSVTLAIPFVIGVEPETRTALAALDTSTASLATNGSTTIALTASGGVFAWGDNSYGILGVSTTLYSRRNIAMQLVLPDTVTPVSVAVRSYTNLIVDSIGRTWGFGRGNYIDGSSNNYTTATRVTALQSIKVRSINGNFVLTTDGRLFLWNPSGSLTAIPSLAGVYVTSFTDRGYIQGCGTSTTDSNYYQVNAVDSDGNIWSIPYSYNYLPGDAERLSISGVAEVKGYGNRAVARTTGGEIYFSYFAGCPYGNVVKPTGTTLVDVAPYANDSNMIAMTDTAKNVWTSSISQSAGVFQPGTWTKLSAIDSVRTSSTDTPKLFSSAPSYIGFASSRIFTSSNSYYENGTCGSSVARLYSTGQFGNQYFQDNVTISSTTAFVGSGSARAFTSGQTLAAQSGDNLIFKLSQPRSSCFTGSTQLSATADLDGNGSYETSLSPTDESGTYAFIATTTAPTSGRKTFSFKLETPIGTSSIFTVNVGVYASAPNSNVTARSKAFNTSYNTAFAVGTDGFGYAWGGEMNFMNILTATPPRTELKPTKITISGNPQIVDGATYVNYDYGDDFGLLVVDADGKVWSWGTRRNMNAPVSTFAVGSVPTTPTQVSALSGVVIKRISTSGGSRALALSDAGNVYQWDSSNRTPTLVSGLAGITIKNIWASGDLYAALSTSGALYTWGGYGYSLGRLISSSDCYWCTDNNVGQATISDQVADVSAGFSRNSDVMTALTTTGKLFSWGNFKTSQVFVPEENTLPGGRTPAAIGSSGSWLYVVATDKTWWRQALDVNRNIVYYAVTNVPADIRNAFSGFSSGTASGVITTNSNLYTLFAQNAGTCGSVGAAARVMSDGQFGSTFADDSIDLQIVGNEITRPNVDNFFNVIASSRCFGATGVTVTADLTGGGTYSSALSSTTADDGSSVNARFKFNTATSGPLYIRAKATTSASVVSTQNYYTLVVPLPPAGRKIGVSVNAGARYTNSSNVVLDLVWPDGVYKIFVSNDGGFAPGTVTEIDLQTQINWVLPPQAVIPLASIVYARFGDETNYYFDDIIIDSISPVLTFASAQ